MSGFQRNIRLTVNGEERSLDVDTRWTLLRTLRESLGLTGTKRGCDRGECGACTVVLEGETVVSCMTLVALCDGAEIVTVEGLGTEGSLDRIQQSFMDNDGGQCGFCTPGFLMSATALLARNPNPTDTDIKAALAGNICRCNAYGRIIASVRAAADGA